MSRARYGNGRVPDADSTPAAPVADPGVDPRRLGDVLRGAGYTDAGIAAVLGLGDLLGVLDADPRTLLGHAAGTDPACHLVRTFVLGLPLSRATAERLLAPVPLAAWMRSAYCAIAVTSSSRPCASCRSKTSGSPPTCPSGSGPEAIATDYVMGPGRSSLTLASLTVRQQCRAVLDVGTGSGVLALRAAAHASQVVGVDRVARATRFARFNRWLNGVPNVAIVRGDLAAAFGRDAFDLVVMNAPFVITPEARYAFRDGDRPIDGLCRTLVQSVPTVLAEGGICQILCHWAHVDGAGWQARVAEWCAGTGCDAWALRFETLPAGAYAAQWMPVGVGATPRVAATMLGTWLAFLERERIDAVTAGLLTLRRRAGGAHRIHARDAPAALTGGDGGAYVAQMIAADDFLATADDAALLAASFRVAPVARLEQAWRPEGGAWHPGLARLRLVAGLGYTAQVEAAMAEVVARCDGTRPLEGVLAKVHGRMGGRPRRNRRRGTSGRPRSRGARLPAAAVTMVRRSRPDALSSQRMNLRRTSSMTAPVVFVLCRPSAR